MEEFIISNQEKHLFDNFYAKKLTVFFLLKSAIRSGKLFY